MEYDISLLDRLSGLSQQERFMIEKKFTNRYATSEDVMLDAERRRPKMLSAIRRQHSIIKNCPELFLACKIRIMDDILLNDARAFFGDEYEEDSINRVVKGRINNLIAEEAARRAPNLYKFLNRPDIYGLISGLREKKITWGIIINYLAKYHSKQYRLHVDNKNGRLCDKHLSATWNKVVAARRKLLGEETAKSSVTKPELVPSE